jgi:DNA helicase II / ATP-dependent DNA helicase PcrA
MLDTDMAKAIRALLARLDAAEFHAASDPLMFLRDAANLDSVQDPSSRTLLNDALSWCFDLLRDGLGSAENRQRVRVGDEHTLLNVPGVHLLTGHVGNGQQFDWVFVVGVEEDTIPDFRANTPAALTEESRILSVMVSRARHGVVISYAAQVVAQTGRVMNRQPSRYWHALGGAGLTDGAGMNNWLAAADWGRIAVR